MRGTRPKNVPKIMMDVASFRVLFKNLVAINVDRYTVPFMPWMELDILQPGLLFNLPLSCQTRRLTRRYMSSRL